jgi:hypothetical protein
MNSLKFLQFEVWALRRHATVDPGTSSYLHELAATVYWGLLRGAKRGVASRHQKEGLYDSLAF